MKHITPLIRSTLSIRARRGEIQLLLSRFIELSISLFAADANDVCNHFIPDSSFVTLPLKQHFPVQLLLILMVCLNKKFTDFAVLATIGDDGNDNTIY